MQCRSCAITFVIDGFSIVGSPVEIFDGNNQTAFAAALLDGSTNFGLVEVEVVCVVEEEEDKLDTAGIDDDVDDIVVVEVEVVEVDELADL